MTRADRLHRLVAKVYPEAAEQHTKDGSWINRHPQPGQKHDPETGNPMVDEKGVPIPARHSGAPYEIAPVDPYSETKGVIVKVFGPDGDVVAGRGLTVDDALKALETKLGISYGEGGGQ